MRIVAGSLRGRRISAPPGHEVRPTADRVREALFSILGPLDKMRVLDLFAGTGALGIEALSRGAASATFVESEQPAFTALEANIGALELDTELVRADALSFLARKPGRRYDLVLLDPPYDSPDSLAGSLSRALPAVTAPEALIVTESDKRAPLGLSLPLVRERTYGRTRIGIHRVD
jgi:16S rRNA (guanine(966)-N(2))-methyltransferase RsmD